IILRTSSASVTKSTLVESSPFASQILINQANARAQCRNPVIAEDLGLQPECRRLGKHQTMAVPVRSDHANAEIRPSRRQILPSSLLQVQARWLTYTTGFGTRCCCSACCKVTTVPPLLPAAVVKPVPAAYWPSSARLVRTWSAPSRTVNAPPLLSAFAAYTAVWPPAISTRSIAS